MAILNSETSGVNWRQVGLFVGVTFTLTWLLDLFLWLTVGYISPAAGLMLQLQMLLPAFSVMVLGLFFFRGSPLNLRRLHGPARWFVFYYLAYTLIYTLLSIGAVMLHQQFPVFSLTGLAVTLLGLLLVVALRVFRGRDALASIGLVWGKPRYWLLFGAGFVLFYGSQTLLNYLFGLGHSVDVGPLAAQAGMPPDAFLIAAAIQTVLVAPFLGLVIAFGEEYGWRGYLQGELVKMGRVRGILLVGIIWGVWHAPVIAMGHNYPGYPVLGPILMVAYTVALAYVLGYAVLKSGSVWLAAFLHALNNGVYSLLVMTVYTPNDPVSSFGLGLYGLAMMAGIVLLILRDPLWREGRAGPPVVPERTAQPSP